MAIALSMAPKQRAGFVQSAEIAIGGAAPVGPTKERWSRRVDLPFPFTPSVNKTGRIGERASDGDEGAGACLRTVRVRSRLQHVWMQAGPGFVRSFDASTAAMQADVQRTLAATIDAKVASFARGLGACISQISDRATQVETAVRKVV